MGLLQAALVEECRQLLPPDAGISFTGAGLASLVLVLLLTGFLAGAVCGALSVFYCFGDHPLTAERASAPPRSRLEGYNLARRG